METIEKTNKHFEHLRWAIDAISKDTARYSLQYLEVAADSVTGCDGRRLHTVSLNPMECGIETGLYRVLKNTKSVIWLDLVAGDDVKPYPKWQDLIPAHTEYIADFNHSEYGAPNLLSALGWLNQSCYNPAYIESALCDDIDRCYFGEKNRPILLSSNDGAIRAVVMPILDTSYTLHDTSDVAIKQDAA